MAPADENLVTDLVPSEMACLANSPGRMRRTAVWISRDEMVDFLEYDASSVGRRVIRMSRSEQSRRGRRTGGFGSDTLEDIVHERVQDSHSLVRDTSIGVDLLEDWGRKERHIRTHKSRVREGKTRTLVDVGGVSLLPGLSPLLLSIGIGRGGSLGGLLGLGIRSSFGWSLGSGRGGGLSGSGSWLSWHVWLESWVG